MNEFVSYVYDFYGKNGIYDMGATKSNSTKLLTILEVMILCHFSEVLTEKE